MITGAIRILYVDDEPGLLSIARHFLERGGAFTVDTLSSASEALVHLQTERYDAIISDYEMPEMDGITFLKRLKESGNTIPFIIFTGKGREDVVIEALNEGADFYLQKGGAPQPQFAELAHKIRQAVQRQQAGLALLESEERYRNVVEVQTEFICRFLPDGTHVFVNEAYCRYFGLNRDGIIGTRFHPAIHPEDAEHVARLIASLSRENPVIMIEQRIMMPDGSIRWQRWIDRAIFHSDGSLKEYQSVGRDITEQKHVEEALVKSEEKYRELVENANSIILRWDKTGNITFFNEFAQRFFGYSNDEIIGKPVMGTIVPATESGSNRDLNLMIDDIIRHPEDHILNENENITRDGNRVWIQWQNKPLLDETGQFTGLLSIGTDITGRKRADEATKESEEKFRSLAESSPDYIMRYDRLCRHTYMNPAALRVSGLAEDRIIGKTHRESGFDESQSRFWEEKITGVFETKRPIKTQFAWDSVDGRVVLDWMLTPEFAPDGTVRSVLGISRDITQLKLAEEELIKKNEELNASYAQISATEEELRQQVEEIMVVQQALSESETRYREFFKTTRDSLFITSPDGRWIDFNDATLELFGYESREVLSSVFIPSLYVHSEARSLLNHLIEREGYVREYPALLKQADGTVIDTLITAAPVRNPDGSLKVFIGTIRDITDRKRADDALQKKEELYRTLVESVHEAIILQEKSGEILTWNRAAEQLFGVAAREVLGHTATCRKWKTIREDRTEFPDSEHPSVHTLETGESCKDVVMGVTRDDGGFSWVNINTSPLFGHGDTKPYAVVISLLDITERKLAGDALRESEERYRLIFEYASFGLLSFDETGHITSCNDRFIQIIGSSREALIGLDMLSLPDERIVFAVREALNGKPGWYEGVYSSVTGNRNTPVRGLFAPMNIGGGCVTGGVGIFEDITERKQVEEALLESEVKYRNIIGNMQELVYQTDVLGNLTMVSPVGIRLAGYTSPDELIGKNIADCLYANPDDRKRFLEVLTERGEVKDFPLSLLAGDGTIRYATASSHFYFDGEGNVLGVEGILHDITERKRVEEALRESEERYLHVIEDQTEFICRFLPDGTHIFVNDAYCRYFGQKREDLIGHRFKPVIHPEDREIVARHITSITPGQPVRYIDQRTMMPDGTICWQHWSDRAVFDPIGQVIEYQSVGRDITEQKAVDEEMVYHEQELIQLSESLAGVNRKLNLLSSIRP